MPDDTITDAISANVTGPKKAAGDAISIEQHSITEQIAADRYLASKDATSSKKLGIKLLRITPGGTV